MSKPTKAEHIQRLKDLAGFGVELDPEDAAVLAEVEAEEAERDEARATRRKRLRELRDNELPYTGEQVREAVRLLLEDAEDR